MNNELTIAVSQQKFPEGTTFAGIQVSVLDSSNTQVASPYNITSEPYVFPLPDLADGTYTAKAVAVDGDGKQLGATVESTFTIKSVLVPVPQSITLATV